jgi:hypothetical protein
MSDVRLSDMRHPLLGGGRYLVVEAGSGGMGGRWLRGQDVLARAAFAGHEDADAFEDFEGRASPFGEECVGAAGALEGVDGAGDDHGRKVGVELLGAADEFVAIHARHEEVTEQEVERSGEGVGYDLEGFLGSGDGCDFVAATGFEEEGPDREGLFIVVNAEDGFFRAHGISVLPAATVGGAAWRINLWCAAAGWLTRKEAALMFPRSGRRALLRRVWGGSGEGKTDAER